MSCFLCGSDVPHEGRIACPHPCRGHRMSSSMSWASHVVLHVLCGSLVLFHVSCELHVLRVSCGSHVLIRVLHTCPGSICLEPRDRTWVGCVCNHVPGHPLLTVACSLVCWPSSEGALSWPDLLSDPSVMGSALQRLAQGRMGLTPGPEEDSLSLVSPSSPAKYFSASGARGREALPGPPGGLWADPSRPLQMRT